MARRRFSRRPYGRTKPRYTWQRWFLDAVDRDNVGNAQEDILLSTLVPGLDNGQTIQPFDSPSVLERIRGQVAHQFAGSATNKNPFVPFSMAMFIVPAEVARNFTTSSDVDFPNLFDNSDGDDYPLYMSHLCDASNVDSVPPSHMVDVKAKRRVEVGSSLVMTASFKIPTALGAGVDVNLGFNLSILWKRD